MKIQNLEPLLRVEEAALLLGGMHPKTLMRLARNSEVHQRPSDEAIHVTDQSPNEFRALLAELQEPYHAMAILAGCLGLARSEFIALKWGDFNWEAATLSIQRGGSRVPCR